MNKDDRVLELKLDRAHDRRAFQRDVCHVGVKLRQCANALYTSGRTLDLSMGGAAIELSGPREAHLGERIAIAFESSESAVARAARMIGAEVIRVEPRHDGRQRIAVRFDAPQMILGSESIPAAA
jgi:c-di-GMP-binding flagellar brake protein YcgR